MVAELTTLFRARAPEARNDVRLIRQAASPGADLDSEALLAGLLQRDAMVQPKFLYDEQGCALFGAICHLQEYYPTRTESGIFRAARREIAGALPKNAQWVDLGCGDAAKSRSWLPEISVRRYIGVDIAEETLVQSTQHVMQDLPDLEVVGVVSDLTRALSVRALLSERPHWPAVFFYPGSSIGNFSPEEAGGLLAAVRRQCGENGGLLIGVDLVKDIAMLEAAYDDAIGVTAAFNLNVLRVINRQLGADFDPRAFAHRAVFNARDSRVEMHLVSRCDQEIHLRHPRPASRAFAEGEAIVTEYSYKYSLPAFARMLREAGFARERVWTDEASHFAVFLALS